MLRSFARSLLPEGLKEDRKRSLMLKAEKRKKMKKSRRKTCEFKKLFFVDAAV